MSNSWSEFIADMQVQKAEGKTPKRNKTFYLKTDVIAEFEAAVKERAKGNVSPSEVVEMLMELFVKESKEF